ncbi:OLC1v1027699C1 [Oldenlandia corymbosa var. corymbosa]|uniref:OLC1v1027699C1 n=1 Tax=Oldenlandia corymbosa var. corymbosa TaxID=529605 RepID=A0AAV1CA30_OLDCO|nr:OLC1v1027699C1 [Oldenlandia corymbosa var. corymbosa]
MEKLVRCPTIVLRVKIHDCDDCPKKLKKLLLQLAGVHWVGVEPKKERVTIIGDVDDPGTLIKFLESKKIKAHLLSYDSNKNVDSEKTEKKKNVGEQQHTCGHGDQSKVDDYHKPHQIEAIEAPQIDPTICTDNYCPIHKRRPIIHFKVPSITNVDHPHHSHGHPFPGANNPNQAPTMEDPNFRFDNLMMQHQTLPTSSSSTYCFPPLGPRHQMSGYRNFRGYPGGAPYPGNFRDGASYYRDSYT